MPAEKTISMTARCAPFRRVFWDVAGNLPRLARTGTGRRLERFARRRRCSAGYARTFRARYGAQASPFASNFSRATRSSTRSALPWPIPVRTTHRTQLTAGQFARATAAMPAEIATLVAVASARTARRRLRLANRLVVGGDLTVSQAEKRAAHAVRSLAAGRPNGRRAGRAAHVAGFRRTRRARRDQAFTPRLAEVETPSPADDFRGALVQRGALSGSLRRDSRRRRGACASR